MAEERTEKRLNPELKDDIPYDIEVDPDDELGDAKQHIHHAESRIHSLRARLKNRSHQTSTTTSTVTDSSTSKTLIESTITTEITSLRSRLLQLEQELKSKDEINKNYECQLSGLSGKDGELERLELETKDLETRVSETTSLLTINAEKSKVLASQVENKSEEVSELCKYRSMKTELTESIVRIDNDLKLKMDSNEQQIQDMSSKDSELARLREVNAELEKKLIEAQRHKEEEISRFRDDMQALQEEIARNGNDLIKEKENNVKLLKEVDEGKSESDQLIAKLTLKNESLVAFQNEKKWLESQVGNFSKQRRLVENYNLEMNEKQDELNRKIKQNELLRTETESLSNEISTQKMRFNEKDDAYIVLEKKLSELQSTLAGGSNKEKALLAEMNSRKQELEDMKGKWQTKMDKDGEVERENAILRQKLEATQSTALLAARKLRDEYAERTRTEAKMNKEKVKIKRELDLIRAECAKNVKMFEAFRAMYEEEQAKYDKGQQEETITLSDQQEDAEKEMKQRIAYLEKLMTRQDQNLARASEEENLNAGILRSAQARLSEFETRLNANDLEVKEIQKKLAKAKREEINVKWSEEQKYQSELATLDKQIEEWKQTAERNEKTLVKTRSEMESQMKLMQSKEDMVQARDQQINTLSTAFELSEAAASKTLPEKKQSTGYGIHVATVIDNRHGFVNPDVHYYKHKNSLNMDVKRVLDEPVVDLETELETLRRKKLIQEAKRRRLYERRPSMG